MKLRIEPPNARQENYSGVAALSAVESNSRILDFAMQRQAQSNWCWAAIAVSMGRYYGTIHREQHELASELLDLDRYIARPQVDECAMLDEALRLAECYSHWSPGRPTFERLRGEIDAGRPVCVQVQWHRGSSHFLAISGYYPDFREVHIEDPLHGPSIQAFDSFPSRYRVIGSVWRGTFWTAGNK